MIGKRIKEIRKFFDLTQFEFGDKIGLKPTAIGQMENGTRNVTERTIILLCERYNINENWLRTGEGEMFLGISPENEVASAISNVLEDINCENAIYTLVKEFLIKYEKLDTPSKKVVEKFIDDVARGFLCQKRRMIILLFFIDIFNYIFYNI